MSRRALVLSVYFIKHLADPLCCAAKSALTGTCMAFEVFVVFGGLRYGQSRTCLIDKYICTAFCVHEATEFEP